MERSTDPITERIIGAAIAVHSGLGPGLLESSYQHCLAAELRARGVSFEREVALPLIYRDLCLPAAYRLDFLVEGSVVVEVKAVEALAKIHLMQMVTYLRIGGFPTGLLLNFKVPRLMGGGFRRVVNDSVKLPALRGSVLS